MNLKDQLIHDICVLQERINCCYDEAPQRLGDVKKLEERQRKAVDTYLVEIDHLEKHKIIRDYRELARNTAKVKILELLFYETHMHMASPNNGNTIYSFQFDKIIEQIDKIYYPSVRLDFTELDEEGHGFSPRRVDPQPELCTSDGWHKDLNPHIIILDPDGWDRKNYQYSFFEERVTRKVYEYRLGMSTIVRKTLEP